MASKFFPVDEENGQGQYPLCETDYFRRLDLICYKCNGALRGSYITALDRKYHIDHFTCSVCPTVFGAQDSYYEHDGQVYCHFHYSTQFAQRCNGCQTAILKQFVEIFRNGQNQHWHPECYMIHKFWNVRLASSAEGKDVERHFEQDTDEQGRNAVRDEEEQMEDKVYRIWSVLSTFEESSAACISDMLLHVSNGAYVDGVLVAKKFIFHVDILFNSADKLDVTMSQVTTKGKDVHKFFLGAFTNLLRAVLLAGGKTPVQKDCSILLVIIQNPGDGCKKTRCHTRTASPRHRTGSLPEAFDSYLPSRSIEGRKGAEELRRPTSVSRRPW